MEEKDLFGLDLDGNPDLSKRIAHGEVGSIDKNMTLSQLITLVTSNIDVYTTEDVNNLLLNYLSKTNLAAYTPTLEFHPATKGYIDGGGIVVPWASLTAGVDVTMVRGKASQVGKVITVTCEYKSGAGSSAGKTVLTIPAQIGVSTVDIDFGGVNESSQNQAGQQLYIPAGSRTVKIRNGGDDQIFYSCSVTYPAI